MMFWISRWAYFFFTNFLLFALYEHKYSSLYVAYWNYEYFFAFLKVIHTELLLNFYTLDKSTLSDSYLSWECKLKIWNLLSICDHESHVGHNTKSEKCWMKKNEIFSEKNFLSKEKRKFLSQNKAT